VNILNIPENWVGIFLFLKLFFLKNSLKPGKGVEKFHYFFQDLLIYFIY